MGESCDSFFVQMGVVPLTTIRLVICIASDPLDNVVIIMERTLSDSGHAPGPAHHATLRP